MRNTSQCGEEVGIPAVKPQLVGEGQIFPKADFF